MAKVEGVIRIVEEIDGNQYVFYMPQGVPGGQAYDGAFGILNKVFELVKERTEQAKKTEAPKEDKKENE